MKKLLPIFLCTLVLSACDKGVVVANNNGPSTSNNNATTSNPTNSGSVYNTSGNNYGSGNNTGNTANNTNTGGSNSGVTTGGSTQTSNNNTSGNTGTTGTEPVVNGNGGPVTTNAASNLNIKDIDAARFLNQATFGASEKSIASFRQATSKSAWIDAQMRLPVSLTKPYTEENSNGSNRNARHEIWMSNALDKPDQLRQRVTFALSQIFVVSDLDRALANAQYGVTDYYDMLARNAFGNYRTLLEDVALHPVMGVYLSMVRNEKANPAENIRPDENFAREVLQLFSIGLFELNNNGQLVNPNNPIPSYTQNTIEEFARVFTGWEHPGSRYWNDTRLTNEAYIGRMVPVEEYHDTDSKTLLNGEVIPAGLNTEQDMQRALDNIFNHKNVGPFISKLLIQRLTTSNPSPAYVGRVASTFNNNGQGVRGDLGAVIKAILLDDEAQRGVAANPNFGKIKEPNIKLTHYWRALEATPGPEAKGIHRTADFPIPRLDEMGGQAVLRSKSVFNFYLPENQLRPGEPLLSPEMQNMSEAFIASTHINYHHMIYRFHNRANLNDDNPRVTITDFEPLANLARDQGALLDWYNLILFAGTMPDTMRKTLNDYMSTLPNDSDGRFAKVQDTLFMIMASPAFNIQY